ncbi:MAG: type I-E CRISPR-associated protein Cse1/CasA [Anaerolineae bacterium]|nr:type I-E CRISPR-associated protein Cse1/CasA [Anaerolineae bacterium]
MTQKNENAPSFNLWTELWITLEDQHGELSQHGIRDTLVHAHEYLAIYDPSPLVVVGIHRLLTAILQDALNPQENADLERLWTDGKFPTDKIEEFGSQYADRFDLFSEDKPFLQSADLPMFPDEKERKAGNSKPVALLFPEIPTGKSLVTHYRHTVQDEQVFSPAAVAAGLATMPPFVSSGGAGLMPSINGAPPPVYVLPGGRTLFETLSASLISPTIFGNDFTAVDHDQSWWKRKTPLIVRESKKNGTGKYRQLDEVGYLHGLTFPARKVRLYPERLNEICLRTGQRSDWCLRTMTYRMGESCREDVIWADPFVAYKLPKASGKRKQKTGKKRTEKPSPIRATRNKTVWREFSGLFLQREQDQQTKRPRFLDQFASLNVANQVEQYPFRCIALVARNDAKIFEWMDFGFDIPPALLRDPMGAEWTDQALMFAIECAEIIKRVFSSTFKRDAKSPERFRRLKERLDADYWSVLAGAFRQFVLDLGDLARQKETLDGWLDTVVRQAQSAFERAADATGDDGNTLLKIEQGKENCRRQLNILWSKTKQGG